MRGIWCPRHPLTRLVRTSLPNGKMDLRCPGCTAARVAVIDLAEKWKDGTRLQQCLAAGCPTRTKCILDGCSKLKAEAAA